MGRPVLGKWLGAAHGQMICEGNQCYNDASGPQIHEVSADGTRCQLVMPQLPRSHMMSNDLLHQTTIVRTGIQALHDSLRERDASLRMVVECDAALFIDCVCDRFANIM